MPQLTYGVISQKNEANNIIIDLRECEGSFKHRINVIMYVPVHACLVQSFVKIYALV